MDKALAVLGMAKKAGLLAVGSEDTSKAIHSGKAKLVITAIDASDGSIRRASINAEASGIPYMAVSYTKLQLGKTAGRGSPGTVAFLDKGLADGFVKKLT